MNLSAGRAISSQSTGENQRFGTCKYNRRNSLWDVSLTVIGIMTDSRSSGAGNDVLFIALHGPNHDGHRFIEPLYGRGVRLFLVTTCLTRA